MGDKIEAKYGLPEKVLFCKQCVDDDKNELLGTITDGDIR